MAFSLTGSVRTDSATAVPGASVRLVGPIESLVAAELAAAGQPDQVAWTRVITGFSGHRWHCWQKFVKNQVAGVDWDEFVDLVVEHNPVLEADGFVFQAKKSYLLPRNVAERQPDVFWTRKLVGFTGNRWQVWERLVRGKVAGIAWQQFKDLVVENNPVLSDDRMVFKSDKTYLLPHNIDQPLLIAITNADAHGHFQFANVPTPGEYELRVQANGCKDFAARLELNSDETIDIKLEAMVTIEPIAPPDIIQVIGGEFRLNGQPIRFIGANIRGLVHYGDPGLMGGHTHQDDRERQLRGAKKMGVLVVRCFLANKNQPQEVIADRLATTLDMLDLPDIDMYLIVSFTDIHSDTGFNVQGDDGFYTVAAHRHMLNRAFFKQGYRGNYLSFVRHIVERFRDHKRILAWELGNELKAQDDNLQILPDLFLPFAHDVAQEIRALDRIHLITTGIINTGSLGMGTVQARQLYEDVNLDFLTVHLYPDGSQVEVARADVEAKIARGVAKPLIVEEFGLTQGDRAVRMASQMNEWFDARGAKGFMQWGFMDTGRDNADGDGSHGMDPGLIKKGNKPVHTDFDDLRRTYRERARNLAF